eukprot:PhF_6_TR10354/c1_g1_i1/m.16022
MLSLFWLLSSVFVLLISPVDSNSRWVLLSLHRDGTVSLLHHRHTPHRVPHKEHDHPIVVSEENGEIENYGAWWVSYRNSVGKSRYIPLPSNLNFHEYYDTGIREGGRRNLQTVETHVQLPMHVDEAHIHHVERQYNMTLSFRHRGISAHVLQDSVEGARFLADVAVVSGYTWQQHNIVFLSGGYTDEQSFRVDYNKILDFLQQGYQDFEHPLSSMPWKRYFSTLNIFPVYQPSPEKGASKPRNNVVVSDNLDCTYGREVERQLTCSRPKAQTLASMAPAADLIVTLVNDKTYGGTGGSGMAFMYTGQYIQHVFLHETGHADGDLMDEYDLGFEEPGQQVIPNCAFDPASPPWKAWGTKLGTPKQVCSYTNYFKAVGSCIMEALYPGLCVVCREAIIRSLFKKKFDLFAPRCPMPGEIVVLMPSDTLDVYVDSRIIQTQSVLEKTGDFTASYQVDNGTWVPIVDIPFRIYADELGPGMHIVMMKIRDNTNMVAARLASMTQYSNFSINVVESVVAFQDSNCSRNINKHCLKKYDNPYCASCMEGMNCTIDLTIRPTQFTVQSLTAELVQSKLPYIVGGGLGVICVIVLFTFMLHAYSGRTVQRVITLQGRGSVIRLTLLMCAVVVMMAGVVGTGLAYTLYVRYSIYGKTYILAFAVYSTAMFIFAYIVFAGAYLKQPKVLYTSTCLFLFGFLLTAFLMVFLFSIFINQDMLMSTMDKTWLDKVKSEPELVCTFESQFKCSGFNNSCVSNSRSSYCPANCDVSNTYGDPCWYKVKSEIMIYFLYAGCSLVAVNTAVLTIMILGVALGRSISKAVEFWTKGRLQKSADMVHHVLSLRELRYVRDRFRNLDSGCDESIMSPGSPREHDDIEHGASDGFLETGELFNFLQNEDAESVTEINDNTMVDILREFDLERDGRIDETEFLNMYCSLVGKDVPHSIADLIVINGDIVRDLWKEFKKVDKDKSLSLDKEEFRNFYEATMGEYVDPKCIDEIFDLLDYDGNGTLNFRELLLIYNPHVQIQYFSAASKEMAKTSEILSLKYGTSDPSNRGLLTASPDYSSRGSRSASNVTEEDVKIARGDHVPMHGGDTVY